MIATVDTEELVDRIATAMAFSHFVPHYASGKEFLQAHFEDVEGFPIMKPMLLNIYAGYHRQVSIMVNASVNELESQLAVDLTSEEVESDADAEWLLMMREQQEIGFNAARRMRRGKYTYEDFAQFWTMQASGRMESGE